MLAAAIAAATIAIVVGVGNLTAAPEERTISFYNIHTKETLTVVYRKDGEYVAEAMEKINWILRDWRRDEATEMDPELIDLLWEIHHELGSSEPIHIISGYRSRETNDMLRKTVGGQATESRHIYGQAADVHFPDVPLKRLRYSALIQERGGVGYYPTSAIPFVHVDTGRVRHWPKLPRYELALLFPSGRSKHVPSDGIPITREDVQLARANYRDLAAQIAEFHHWKSMPKTTLLAQVDRPQAADRPSEEDRARLTELAALADSPPRLVSGPTLVTRRRPETARSGSESEEVQTWSRSWRVAALESSAKDAASELLPAALRPLPRQPAFVQAPAYDEEHPEELSYRPFPIAPLLTATPSIDDPALARLVHPDLAKTIELIDQVASVPPLRLRPGPQLAQILWAAQFTGDAFPLAAAPVDTGAASPPGIASRKVQTTR
jgi:uncharacterized protein YcbK (DUF882 family)